MNMSTEELEYFIRRLRESRQTRSEDWPSVAGIEGENPDANADFLPERLGPEHIGDVLFHLAKITDSERNALADFIEQILLAIRRHQDGLPPGPSADPRLDLAFASVAGNSPTRNLPEILLGERHRGRAFDIVYIRGLLILRAAFALDQGWHPEVIRARLYYDAGLPFLPPRVREDEKAVFDAGMLENLLIPMVGEIMSPREALAMADALPIWHTRKASGMERS